MTRQELAIAKFTHDLATDTRPHHGLVALAAHGWDEHCPSRDFWSFHHPDLPSVTLYWSPGYMPWT